MLEPKEIWQKLVSLEPAKLLFFIDANYGSYYMQYIIETTVFYFLGGNEATGFALYDEAT